MKEPDYKRIFDNATEYAIFTMDLDRRITSWNKGAEKLLGWSADEAIGQKGDIVFPEGEKEGIITELQRVHEDGKALDERWHVKKDSSRFWAVGRMLSVTNDSNEIDGYLKILLDQTEKKQQERELRDANEELQKLNEELEDRVADRTAELESYRDKLRSLVAELNKAEERERGQLVKELHDHLAQILAMCRMQLELAQSDLLNSENSRIAKARDLVDEAIRYTRELMSDLRPPTELDKEDILTIMNWLAKKMDKHELQVMIDDDGKPKPLRPEIKHAFLLSVRELLFNIKKHAGVEKAQVIMREEDKQVRITVKDQGRGFDPEKLELKPNSDGGFGLFNLQERFDLLGGNMELHSKPGEGTTITLMAPVDG